VRSIWRARQSRQRLLYWDVSRRQLSWTLSREDRSQLNNDNVTIGQRIQMKKQLNGHAWVFGDDINTDLIIPARYLNTTDRNELASHLMEDEDTEFAKRINTGDIIVAGKNFGCGSSREHAPIAIQSAGIGAVIAESYARIFFRNAINIGLPILESAKAAENIETGDAVQVDLDQGLIINKTKNTQYNATIFPEFMQKLIEAGGLMAWVKKERMK
jgi:3-isopropylmalate/(R)-2-methylmalate dehydratase small subunit